MSYKTRNIMLAAGAIVMLFLVYQVSIRKTIALYQENTRIEEEIQFADKAPAQLQYYRGEAQRLRKVLNSERSSGEIREDILRTAATGSERYGVLLRNLSEPSYYVEGENIQVQTYEVTLQGDYLSLLRTLVHLEEHIESGKVVSARFEMEKNKAGARVVLHLFIQTSTRWQ